MNLVLPFPCECIQKRKQLPDYPFLTVSPGLASFYCSLALFLLQKEKNIVNIFLKKVSRSTKLKNSCSYYQTKFRLIVLDREKSLFFFG